MTLKAKARIAMRDAMRAYVRASTPETLSALREAEAAYKAAKRQQRFTDPADRANRRFAQAHAQGWTLREALSGVQSRYTHACGHTQDVYHVDMVTGRVWCRGCEFDPRVKYTEDIPADWTLIPPAHRPAGVELQSALQWFRHSCGDERGCTTKVAALWRITCTACDIRADRRSAFNRFMAPYGWTLDRIHVDSAKGVKGRGKPARGVLRHSCGARIVESLERTVEQGRLYCPECEPHIL